MAERKGIMLAYPFEERRLNKWKPPYLVQPKLDGERCRAIINPSGVTLLSSSEREITSVPHINKELGKLIHPSVDIELDGELYTHGLSFEDIQSIVGRTTNLHPDYKMIDYYVFDIVNPEPQYIRTQKVLSLESDSLNIFKVPVYMAENFEEVMRAYDGILLAEYEGIIIRNFLAPYIRRRSIYMMKFKPRKNDYYKIIGFRQMVDEDGYCKPMLGSLLLTGDDGTQFSVGSGMNDEFRSKFWPKEKAAELIGKICHIQYQHLTSDRVPRFPVFVEVVEL